MTSDGFDDNPLDVSESLDSDEIRNADGDEVADPPDQWIECRDHETLTERLAEEEPDVDAASIDPTDADGEAESTELRPNDELDRIDPEVHGVDRGQIDGTPEDGDSFFDVD